MSQSRRKGKSAEAYHSLMTRALVVLAASLGLLACGRPPAAPAAATAIPSPAPAAAPAAYAPDLGELMLLQQMRHAKLWLSGDAGNWKLAAYELGEMREAFEQIAKLHPTHKNAPVPIDQAIETIMTEPLDQMSKAIQAADRKAFAAAFDNLTQGCNSCHGATDYGFSVLQRPKSNPFPNQDFAAK